MNINGACKNADPELFFPLSYTSGCENQIEQAKAICRSCPGREKCLDRAMEHPLDDGIWGGLTPAERRRLARPTADASRTARR